MALKIYIGEEVLDLPRDYTLEWNITSPIFNERGSQTVPLTLPATPHNLKLLAHPERIDAAERSDVRDGAFADGIFYRRCKINVLGSSADGIEISLGTDESLMYAEWNDRKLREVPGLPVYTPTGNDPLGTLISLMNACYRRQVELDYHVFPVAVEFNEPSEDTGSDDIPVCTILNEVYRDDTVREEGDLIGTTLYSEARTVTVGKASDGNTVDVPRGYGITPFLRVGRFLHTLFACYGYTLADNIFDTDPQLKRLVILNNTADAICTGTLSYADLLPDCTVNEFLESLKAHFGAVFYLDGSSLTARCVLLRDTLAADPDVDLTQYHALRPELTFNEPRQLVLASKSSYIYADTKEETFAEFLAKYGNLTDTNAGGRFVKGVPKYEQDLFTGTIYLNGATRMEKIFFSSMQWPWNRKTDKVAEESVEGADVLVPMYTYRGTGTVGGFPPFCLFALPLFLSGVRNAHTVLKASTQEDDTLTQKTDLAFCFAHGNYITPGDEQSYGLYYGSPLCYAPDGSHYRDAQGNLYHSSLIYVGESGAYARYWSSFDHLLRYANRTVKTEFVGAFAGGVVDASRPKLLFGQPLLLDSLGQTFPLSRHVSREATFRSIKLLDPVTPVAVPDISSPLGYWAVESNEATVKGDLLTAIHESLASQYSSYEIIELRWVEVDKDIPSSSSHPTAQQVANSVTQSYTYGLRVEYRYKYKRTGFLYWESGNASRSTATAAVTVTRTATAY